MERLFLLKVKKGKLDTWREWCLYLNTRKDDVLETFKHEKTLREAGYLFSLNDEWYVFGLQKKEQNGLKSDKSIELNRLHDEKIKECLEYVSEGEVLFSFE